MTSSLTQSDKKPDFASQTRLLENGLVGGVATRSVGQQKVFFRIDVVEQRFFAAIEIHPAHGDSHHLRSADFEGARGFLKRTYIFQYPR